MDELPTLLDEEGDVTDSKMASTSAEELKQLPPRKRQTEVVKQEGIHYSLGFVFA